MNGTDDIGQESADISEWASVPPTEEQLDEDELATDPLEEGMDAPDDWAAADRYATTPGNSAKGSRWRPGWPRNSRISSPRANVRVRPRTGIATASERPADGSGSGTATARQ